ncbi:rab-GTPase-TBC domain-containing protein [Calycina marina]|uniref:Rab-GTPase-TBC domain-containing protein n=1 Tax=Calycina marina TaxID=1763456 RepID=A0A9P7Z8P2_9HELO|nr:rab-GTPase-TBC domain-containing protein [Calycina marina]
MLSLEESRSRWNITIRHAASLDELRKSVRSDGVESPCRAVLRSVCWKTFLLFQTTEVTGWSRILIDSRSAYTSLREHLLRFIENPDEIGSSLDPLDDDQQSPWNTLRQDEEIRAEIFQDIERCMPDEPFFRDPATQSLMLDILFIFCKINQDVGYRQGMHEILAPILWVIHHDAIDDVPDGGKDTSKTDDLMKETLDSAFIEHDAFTILCLVMRTAKSFYELGEPENKAEIQSSIVGVQQAGASPIVERSRRIHEVYLARVDPALARHITGIEVLPQIFLIRWIRLLFGREFPFEELLELWDVLLAEDPGLELVDMVCVAMLLRIRWQLIETNYSTALILLLKYPAPSHPNGPQSFVSDAVYLRDNFNVEGGAHIISKYSGRSPSMLPQGLRPPTPFDQGRMNFPSSRSPLPSPTRFLQQQGGVEALLQGAAKGVFDRGERLGINQAVRDAVGEVKKNMQGLQGSRANPVSSKRGTDVIRWSLDEGRAVPTARAALAAMNVRNQQLSRMLDQAMAELRLVSTSVHSEKEEYVNAIDLAVAKVDFVKIYLEDSTMPLPAEQESVAPSQSPLRPTASPKTALAIPDISEPLEITRLPQEPAFDTIAQDLPAPTSTAVSPRTIVPEAEASPVVMLATEAAETAIPHRATHLTRPAVPVPTRSTIANSSFSWMLGSEKASSSDLGLKGASPKLKPPFLTSSRKPTSGASREKAAFLFGEDGEDSPVTDMKSPSSARSEVHEVFNLESIRSKNNDQ